MLVSKGGNIGSDIGHNVPAEPKSIPSVDDPAVFERVRVETLMRFKLEVRTLTICTKCNSLENS